MWCLLDFYFRKEHDCSCSFKVNCLHFLLASTIWLDSNLFHYGYQDPCGTMNEVSIMSAIEYTDAVHNFILSQKLTSLLGNFPEVMNFQILPCTSEYGNSVNISEV